MNTIFPTCIMKSISGLKIQNHAKSHSKYIFHHLNFTYMDIDIIRLILDIIKEQVILK